MVFTVLQEFLWRFVYNLVEKFFLYAPRWIGGKENLAKQDICAAELGISALNFLNGQGEMLCLEKINSICTSRTLIVITIFICGFIFWLPLVIRKGFALKKEMQTKADRKVRYAANAIKGAATKELNKKNMEAMNYITSVCCTPDINNDCCMALIRGYLKESYLSSKYPTEKHKKALQLLWETENDSTSVPEQVPVRGRRAKSPAASNKTLSKSPKSSKKPLAIKDRSDPICAVPILLQLEDAHAEQENNEDDEDADEE